MASPHMRKALGRGLTNLIPTATEDRGSGDEVVYVDINAIVSNPFQPRQDFDKEEIDNLAQSINNQGLLQPILLRKKDAGYEIISGERRFRAMKQLGNDKVPCIIKPKITDNEMIEMALVENIQRENLNDIEQAYAYQQLLVECGLSHEEISKKVGKSRSTVTNFLRLLKLPEDLQKKLRKKEFSMGHARALLAIEDPIAQREMAQKITSDKLTVRDIENSAHREPPGKHKNKPHHAEADDKKGKDPNLLTIEEKMRYRFGTQVTISQSLEEKGKIEIYFYSMGDMNRILDLILTDK